MVRFGWLVSVVGGGGTEKRVRTIGERSTPIERDGKRAEMLFYFEASVTSAALSHMATCRTRHETCIGVGYAPHALGFQSGGQRPRRGKHGNSLARDRPAPLRQENDNTNERGNFTRS